MPGCAGGKPLAVLCTQFPSGRSITLFPSPAPCHRNQCRGIAPREQGQGGRCSPTNSYREDSQLQSQGDWPQALAGAAGQDPSATTHPKMTIRVHCLLIKRCQQQTEKGVLNSNPNLLLSCQSYLPGLILKQIFSADLTFKLKN